MKLTDSEKSILRELIFPEPFEHIQEETGLGFGTIRDDLIKLIIMDLLKSMKNTPLQVYLHFMIPIILINSRLRQPAGD